MNLTTRRTTNQKTQRLSLYPVLAGVSLGALADIATWADEFTISSSEVVGGLTPVNRWTYLVANPAARVMVHGGCRPAGQILAHTDDRGDASSIVAVDDLNVLSIPSQRLHHLLEIVPRLADTLREASEQTSVVDPLCGEGLLEELVATLAR